MKWTLREIRDYPDDIMPFDEQLDIAEELMNRDSEIISVQAVHVDGYITPVEDALVLHGTMCAELTLPSSRSLVPVEVALDIPIKERYVTKENDIEDDDFEEVTMVLEHDYIDLSEVAVDTILLNLPIRVLAPGEESEELPAGKDWEVLTQEQFEAKLQEEKAHTIDPRFEALKTLLDEDH